MTPTARALVLVLLAFGGCATQQPGPELEPALLAGPPAEGLTPTGDGSAIILGVYALGAAVLVAGFVVDLFLLPFSADCPELFFPCCRELLDLATD